MFGLHKKLQKYLVPMGTEETLIKSLKSHKHDIKLRSDFFVH